MNPFLKQVAEHYLSKGDIDKRCFIFPNRRSMVFFKKYLGEALSYPIISPKMVTINDFFFSACGGQSADRVTLLLELYRCYKELNPKAESLDEFIFWGDVILGDFNDIDKYLVNPKQLFANVADLKSIQDDFSYLTEQQRKAIEGFISHFSNSSGRLTVELDTDNPDVKARFLMVWNILYRLYSNFNSALKEKGLAYEGMVYRELAEAVSKGSVADILETGYAGCSSFVFVGLNALNECEKTVLRKMKEASLAEFCWDYCGKIISDSQNRSSFFLEKNISEFGQAAKWDAESQDALPEINVISVPSGVGQAKRLPQILKENWEDCAVILPDERLLSPVLNVIPEHIKDINVTMGVPMSGSVFYTMMADVASIQLHAVNRSGKWCFYHKQVWSLFSNEVFRKAMSKESEQIVRNVKAKASYYIAQEELTGTPLFDVIFRPAVPDVKTAGEDQIRSFSEYLKSVIKVVAPAMADDPDLALELEFAKEYYKCVNQLMKNDLAILPVTYVKLLCQLLMSVSVPFRGEPLKGLQIMGPLEMRALDFSNLIIMSANEGVFPRRSVSSSFIPPELRKGFGLPTYEYQDAVWAYYFYRAISRARKVWLFVDSRTEGIKVGEESRYIKQLEYHFGVPVNRYSVQFEKMNTAAVTDIEKTPDNVAAIRKMYLSASSLQNYLECPAKFYYGSIMRLKAEDEIAESLDNSTLGTVYHEVMCAIYSKDSGESLESVSGCATGCILDQPFEVTRGHLQKWADRKDEIKAKVNSLIKEKLKVDRVEGRNLVVADVIHKYILKTLEQDLALLNEQRQESFKIHGLEVLVESEFMGQRFKGYIDRLDSLGDNDLRVVDYKTGKVLPEDEEIEKGKEAKVIEKIFALNVAERPKIALQFYIYDMLLRNENVMPGRVLTNSVYSTAKLFRKAPEIRPVNETFYDGMTARMQSLLEELYDLEIPFKRTSDGKKCTWCDFKNICGR